MRNPRAGWLLITKATRFRLGGWGACTSIAITLGAIGQGWGGIKSLGFLSQGPVLQSNSQQTKDLLMENFNQKPPRAPSNLSKEAQRLWREIVSEYGITDKAGLLLLATCLEAFCRMREAQAVLTKEGLVITDRFGQHKSHPACVTERDSRSQMLMAMKMLNLDLEPLKDSPGRPPGVRK
jgi:P27 family predicted phage terminase small subunit